MIRVGEMYGKRDVINLKRIAYSLFLIILLFDIFFMYIIFTF